MSGDEGPLQHVQVHCFVVYLSAYHGQTEIDYNSLAIQGTHLIKWLYVV